MAPPADTSFAAHATTQFSSYEGDRQKSSSETIYATSNGVPMPHPYETQRVGENGPLLLQDFHLIDLLSHFDRERIPERVVHTKGSGTHEFFECTEAIPDLTLANIFAENGKKCPITVRFSTVGGESGSHDCARDPRGFSVKFVNAGGEWKYVQIHFKSMQGTKFITQEDSANYSSDYSQKDLYEAIGRGEYPKWSVEIQVMSAQEAEKVVGGTAHQRL